MLKTQKTHRRWLALLVPVFVMGMFTLSACGSNATGIGTTRTTTGSAPSPITSTPTLTGTAASTSGCPANEPPAGSNVSTEKPDVTIKMGDSNTIVSAKNGNLIEIQLPDTNSWGGPNSSEGNLKLLGTGGYLSVAQNACIWHFMAQDTGKTTLEFSGRPICKKGAVCPHYMVDTTFTIDVK